MNVVTPHRNPYDPRRSYDPRLLPLRQCLLDRRLDRLEPRWVATGLDPMVDQMTWRNGWQARRWYATLDDKRGDLRHAARRLAR